MAPPSNQSKQAANSKGGGGVIGAIVPPKKKVDQFPLMSFVAKNCSFQDDSQDAQDEESLKAANDLRFNELLNQAKHSQQEREKEATLSSDSDRKKALEVIHSLEWARNQEDNWKVTKPETKKVPDYGGFLHPLKKCDKEEEYFSGTRKVKQPKERKRTRSDDVVVLDGVLVAKNSASPLPIQINLPPRPRVPSCGLPFEPGPPTTNVNNPWMQRSGSDLFSNVRSNTIVAYGINCDEEEAMALAIAESIRTAKEEQIRKVDPQTLYSYDKPAAPVERYEEKQTSRLPQSDSREASWDTDDNGTFMKTASPKVHSFLEESRSILPKSKDLNCHRERIYSRYSEQEMIAQEDTVRAQKLSESSQTSFKSNSKMAQRSKYLEKEEIFSKPLPNVQIAEDSSAYAEYSFKGKIANLGDLSSNYDDLEPRGNHNTNENFGKSKLKSEPSSEESRINASEKKEQLKTQTDAKQSSPVSEEKKGAFRASRVPETFSMNPVRIKQALGHFLSGDNSQNTTEMETQPLDISKKSEDRKTTLESLRPKFSMSDNIEQRQSSQKVDWDNQAKPSLPRNADSDDERPSGFTENERDAHFMSDRGNVQKTSLKKPSCSSPSMPGLISQMATFSHNPRKFGKKPDKVDSPDSVESLQDKVNENGDPGRSDVKRGGSFSRKETRKVETGVSSSAGHTVGLSSDGASIWQPIRKSGVDEVVGTNDAHPSLSQTVQESVVPPVQKMSESLVPPVVPPANQVSLPPSAMSPEMAAAAMAAFNVNLQMMLMHQQALNCAPSGLATDQSMIGAQLFPNQAQPFNNMFSGLPNPGSKGPPSLQNLPGVPNFPFGFPSNIQAMQSAAQAGMMGLPNNTVPAMLNPFPGAVPGFPNVFPGSSANLPVGFPAPTNFSGVDNNFSAFSITPQNSSLINLPGQLNDNLPAGLAGRQDSAIVGNMGLAVQPGDTPLRVGKGRGRLNRGNPAA